MSAKSVRDGDNSTATANSSLRLFVNLVKNSILTGLTNLDTKTFALNEFKHMLAWYVS